MLKNFEKILWLSILIILIFFHLPEFNGKYGTIGLLIIFVSISYLLGSNWFFKNMEEKVSLISILAGLAFACSIFSLPFLLKVREEVIFKILPLFNLLLFVGLTIYLLLNKNLGRKSSSFFRIYIRSIFLLIPICFLAYFDASNKLHREVIKQFNKNDNLIKSNILMFDFNDSLEVSLKNKDCDKAIKFGEEANRFGEQWLKLLILQKDKSPSQFENMRNDNLWKIFGTHVGLHNAYVCKAEFLIENGKTVEADRYFFKADSIRAVSLQYLTK